MNAVIATTETLASKAARHTFAGVRLSLGWTFLWALLDKTRSARTRIRRKASNRLARA
jgi:hypothetical protein